MQKISYKQEISFLAQMLKLRKVGQPNGGIQLLTGEQLAGFVYSSNCHLLSYKKMGVCMVSAEFPRDLLSLLRCSRDKSELELISEGRSNLFGIIAAKLQCRLCGCGYEIRDGIARMMVSELTAEDQHEITIRDDEYERMWKDSAAPPETGWRSKLSDLLEIPPNLRALQPLEERKVLEIGCGDGRYTILMAQLGARVLAADFSLNALRRIGARLPEGLAPTSYRPDGFVPGRDLRGRVGLVHAHASYFHVAPRSFQRALSATPLDDREQRMAMFAAIADALCDEGRYIGGVEHDDLMRRLLGLPQNRRYEEGGVYIEHFREQNVRRETAPYFLRVQCRPIRPRIPFARYIPTGLGVLAARTLYALPVLRDFGEILLFRASKPVRTSAEDEMRPGNMLVKVLFRTYLQIRQQLGAAGGHAGAWEGKSKTPGN